MNCNINGKLDLGGKAIQTTMISYQEPNAEGCLIGSGPANFLLLTCSFKKGGRFLEFLKYRQGTIVKPHESYEYSKDISTAIVKLFKNKGCL